MMIIGRMAEQFKLKGKWMPGEKKEEARSDDTKELIRVMGILQSKPLECHAVGCHKPADVIIHRFPFCATHGLEYQKANASNE